MSDSISAKTDSSFFEHFYHWDFKIFLILSKTWCVVKIMIYLRRDVSFLARHWIHIQKYRFISAKNLQVIRLIRVMYNWVFQTQREIGPSVSNLLCA